MQAGNFGYPRACVVEHGKQCPVPPASSTPRIGCAEDGLHLIARQEAEQLAVETLHWYGKNPLGRRQSADVVARGVAEEGADGGNARVATARAVGTVSLKVVEKRQHQLCIEIGEGDSGRRLAGMPLGEQEQ